MAEATQTALIIGITGSVGHEIATALLGRGWCVRALHRDPPAARKRSALAARTHWIEGDAMQCADVIRAADGASLIVHAANPPKYHDWRGLALPMLRNTIKAAHVHGARIVLPGTIYNFAPAAGPLLSERSAQNPPTAKGEVRLEMEILLQQASLYGVRSVVVRAGDFFGPGAGNSWLTQGLVRTRGRLRTVYYPGSSNAGHSWAYLPDLADAVMRLLESPQALADYEVFHFRGHWFDRGAELAQLLCRLAGIAEKRIKPFPWWLVRAASPWVEVFREMLEMRYLWESSLQLDNAKLRARIGAEPHTPIDVALKATLKEMLPTPGAEVRRTPVPASRSNSHPPGSRALQPAD